MTHDVTGSEGVFGGHTPREQSDYLLTIHADPAMRAQIAAAEFEGMPGAYALKCIDMAVGWAEEIRDEDFEPAVVNRVMAGLASWESDYPGSGIWDRMRQSLAGKLFEAGGIQASLDLVYGMRSRHMMADTVIDLATREGDELISGTVFSSFIRRFQGYGAKELFIGFIQALIDLSIDRQPEGELAGRLENILTSRVPDYDPVQAWADSQTEPLPDVDWDDLVPYIRNDDIWQGVPVHYRQFAVKQCVCLGAVIAFETSTELVTHAIDEIDAAQAKYPETQVWDRFKLTFAEILLGEGNPMFALDFGRSIVDSAQRQILVGSFIENGAEEEALELTCSIPDAAVMAAALLDTNWSNNQGPDQLARIVQDDKYPLERRIACIEAISERMAAQGKTDWVKFYDELLAALREQLAAE